MEVVWRNTQEPIKSDGHWAVPCAVCGIELLPFNHLGCYELPVGWNYAGYDYPYWVCSEECDNETLRRQKHLKLNQEFAKLHDTKIPAWMKKIFLK